MLALIPFTHAAENGDSECPPNLRAWKTYGSAEAGGEWGAGFVEIRGEVGVLRDLVLIFGDGALPPDEARWFDAPEVLEPVGLHTRTLSLVGEELAALCGELSGPALKAAVAQARPRCFVDENGGRTTIRTESKLTNPTDVGSTGGATSGIGLKVGAHAGAEDELVCAPMEELESAFEEVEPVDAEPNMLDAIAAVFAALERKDAPLETGLPALPPARHILEVLRTHDEGLIPENLPSEFYLTAIAAPGPYAESLALERMLTSRDADEEVALKLLGDEVSLSAASLLKLKLRESVETSRARVVALTLRALLAADPDAARLEAMPLLEDPLFARAALGVFALTEPELQEDLDAIDLEDGAAVADAGRRVQAFLEQIRHD